MGSLDELFKILTANEKTYVYAGDVTKSCYPKKLFLVSDVEIVPGKCEEDLIARSFGYPEGIPPHLSFKLQRYEDGKLIEFHRGVEADYLDPESSFKYAGITFPSKEELDGFTFVDGIPFTSEEEARFTDAENKAAVRQLMVSAIERYLHLINPNYSEKDFNKIVSFIDSLEMTPGDALASKRVRRSFRLSANRKK